MDTGVGMDWPLTEDAGDGMSGTVAAEAPAGDLAGRRASVALFRFFLEDDCDDVAGTGLGTGTGTGGTGTGAETSGASLALANLATFARTFFFRDASWRATFAQASSPQC